MARQIVAVAEVKRSLSFVWAKESDQKETYEFSFAGDSDWGCVRHSAMGERKFRLAYDRPTGTLWWGQSYFLDPTELVSKPDRAHWYKASDYPKPKRAAFVWLRKEARHSEVKPKAAPVRNHLGQSTSTKVIVKARDDPPAPAPAPAARLPLSAGVHCI